MNPVRGKKYYNFKHMLYFIKNAECRYGDHFADVLKKHILPLTG